MVRRAVRRQYHGHHAPGGFAAVTRNRNSCDCSEAVGAAVGRGAVSGPAVRPPGGLARWLPGRLGGPAGACADPMAAAPVEWSRVMAQDAALGERAAPALYPFVFIGPGIVAARALLVFARRAERPGRFIDRLGWLRCGSRQRFTRWGLTPRWGPGAGVRCACGARCGICSATAGPACRQGCPDRCLMPSGCGPWPTALASSEPCLAVKLNGV
jgi:hypothetical protein